MSVKKLTETFNEIAVAKGELFEVELHAASGAGYLWDVVATSGAATLVSREHISLANSGVGGGDLQRFVFRADEEGAIELEAAHRRPFETKPILTRKMTVQVN